MIPKFIKSIWSKVTVSKFVKSVFYYLVLLFIYSSKKSKLTLKKFSFLSNIQRCYFWIEKLILITNFWFNYNL